MASINLNVQTSTSVQPGKRSREAEGSNERGITEEKTTGVADNALKKANCSLYRPDIAKLLEDWDWSADDQQPNR